jgi:hypothetical protein
MTWLIGLVTVIGSAIIILTPVLWTGAGELNFSGTGPEENPTESWEVSRSFLEVVPRELRPHRGVLRGQVDDVR